MSNNLAFLFSMTVVELLGAYFMFQFIFTEQIKNTAHYLGTVAVACICLIAFGETAAKIVHIIQAGV